MADETPEIPLHGKMRIIKAVVEKLHEFRIREIDGLIETIETMPMWEAAVALAKWNRMVDLLFEVEKAYERRYSGPRGEMKLFEEAYGDQLGLPDRTMPQDVTLRLDWYRQRIAKQYERKFRQTVNEHTITSPVEQIFLMEWHFLGMDGRLGVKLHPQHEIKVDGHTYKADFAVLQKAKDLRLVVEIDGHDFHEKTRNQVAKDKARERAIVKAGYTVLRFTGSEVVRNPRKCVEEVAAVVAGD